MNYNSTKSCVKATCLDVRGAEPEKRRGAGADAGLRAQLLNPRVCVFALLFLAVFWVETIHGQTVLVNGADQAGDLLVNTTNVFTFSASTGDSINLRLGTTGYNGRIQLFEPNGAQVAITQATIDDLIVYTATNNGTFTVWVSSWNVGGSGPYVLHLAQVPEAFIVPAGDEGGPMTNGGNYPGTNTLGDLDMWSFTANAGDSINLRLGTTGYNGRLELYGPNGAQVAITQATIDDLIVYTATNSGTFTVLVSSWNVGGTGTYVLHLAQVPEAFIVPPGDEGGALMNGGNYPGTNSLGDIDMWTFTANAGDSINLRLGTTGYNGRLELYGPNGAQVAITQATIDDLIVYTATNSGTFTVLVSSWNVGSIGTYVLHLAQAPESFIVPAGDEGGALTNGGDTSGTIALGDLDLWRFTANAGDRINLRLGTIGFSGKIELYGPNGAELAITEASVDDLIAYTATNSGTFTVLVSSWNVGSSGTYVLHLAQVPEAFIVPAGDEGGALTNDGNFTGTIDLADIDMWTFTACSGDFIQLHLNTTNTNGRLELYGPNGALLALVQANTVLNIDYGATNCGRFTVLVSSWNLGVSGTYSLNAHGLEDQFKICSPLISGANLTINGVGGVSNALVVLDTTTNLGIPLALWTPINTNRFDGFGVFTYTNVYRPRSSALLPASGAVIRLKGPVVATERTPIGVRSIQCLREEFDCGFLRSGGVWCP